jgi:hypothetical protein
MSAREIQDQKAIAGEMFAQQTAQVNAGAPASTLPGATISSTKSRRGYIFESATAEFCEAADASLLLVVRVLDANLVRVLRQLQVVAKRQAPRIAFKSKGSIRLFDLADILALCVPPSLAGSESVLLHPSSTDQYFRELQREKPVKTLGFW